MRPLFAFVVLATAGCGVAFSPNDGVGGSSASSTTTASSSSGAGGDVSAGGAAVMGAGGTTAQGGASLGGGGSVVAPVVVETMSVPAAGQVVSSVTALANGVSYTLRITGTVMVTATFHGDAEYWGFVNNPTIEDFNPGGSVDLGVAINGAASGPTKQPHWGAYDATHVYTYDVFGAGVPITARYYDGDFSNNSGTLTLEIIGPP